MADITEEAYAVLQQQVASMPDTRAFAAQFVNQYYQSLDQRFPQSLYPYYLTDSMLTFDNENHRESAQTYGVFIGTEAIATKLSFPTIQTLFHSLEDDSMLVQPGIGSSYLIMVFGELQCDEDPPRLFSETFFLAWKPDQSGLYIKNQIFRFTA